MTTISYITNKVLNMDNNVFSLNYDKSDPVKPLMKLVFMSLVNNRYKGKFNIIKVPNITNICYGRGVGYKIEEIILPKEIQEISATKIREKLNVL